MEEKYKLDPTNEDEFYVALAGMKEVRDVLLGALEPDLGDCPPVHVSENSIDTSLHQQGAAFMFIVRYVFIL